MSERKAQNILAIETTLEPGSVSILRDSFEIETCLGASDVSSSEDLLWRISELLEKNQLRPSDINLIAVSLGPGSFTGTRVGLATAKGLALGDSSKCIGVSTLEAMANSVRSVGRIRSVTSGSRGQVFFQDFRQALDSEVEAAGEIRRTGIERLIEDIRISGLDAIVLEEKLKHIHESVEANLRTEIQPPELSKYVGLVAIKKFLKDISIELSPIYGEGFEAERRHQT